MSESATTVIPHLCCRNAEQAVEFYGKAFGAKTEMMLKSPDGKVMHACISIDGAHVFLADEFPEYGGAGPETLGGTPVTLHMNVNDCDAVFDRAVKAGCTAKMPLADMFWGDRYGLLVDPYGHNWSIATHIRDVSEEEMQQAVAQFGQSEGSC